MDMSKVLQEMIQNGGVFEVPEFAKIKSMDWDGGDGDRHTAIVRTYCEGTGETTFKITLEEIKED